MNLKRLIPLIFTAASLVPTQSVNAQDYTKDIIPRTEIEVLDEKGKLNSSLDFILDKYRKSADLEFLLKTKKTEHKFGLNFLINKDPVWSTINTGIKYDFLWKPLSFLEQKFKTYTGYQYVSSIEVPFLYNTSQFFTGGEESLNLIIGDRDKARLETKGILGGYVSLLNKELVWDNYITSYKVSGTLPVSFFNFKTWFSQAYTRFNKDKYFFLDSSNNMNFGGSLELDLEPLFLNAFFKKEYCFGKELNQEKIFTGLDILFKEAGVNLRGNIELNQTYPELFYFNFGIGKTIFDNRAYAELAFNLFENNPPLEFRVRVSPGNEDGKKIILKKPIRRLSPLIEEKGYDKPSENFDEAIKKTDTLIKIGNVGNYFPYATGLSPVRTPQQFFEDGYGDCDEIAWYRTYAARKNGYEDSWFVGYYDWNQNMGHAFFLVRDKDKRVYVTDNDHGVWLKLDVNENTSKEEMAKAAVEQLSRYMALPLPKGNKYGLYLFDENGKTPIYYNENLTFNPANPKNAPIDTGLMSRLGREPFY